MSKRTKKRSKVYRGPDAATGPRVHRYSVTEESAFQSWWKENKRVALARLGLGVVAIFVSWLIYLVIN